MKRLPTYLLYLFLAYVAAFIYFDDRPSLTNYAATLDLLLVAASVACFWAAAAAAPSGVDRIWYRIALGLLVWCLAIVLRLLEKWLDQPDYGTLSDGFWVAGYLPLVSGSYLWYRFVESGRRQRWILALALTIAGAAIYLLFQLPLILDPHRSLFRKSLDVIYVAMDLLILGYLYFPSRRADASGCRALLAGVLVVLASDIVLGHYGEARASWVYVYLDLLYSAGYFLLALAGIRQREINVSHR